MIHLLRFYIYMLYLYCVFCFNIDTTNVLIFTSKQGTEFGFTSGMLENSQGKWLLVGSPKDTFTDVPAIDSPGNVYKCPINVLTIEQSGCETFTLRSGERTRQSSSYPYEQTKQLLGSNLLITNNAVVICAPLWKHVFYATTVGLEYPIGFCYQMDRSFQTITTRFYSSLNSSSNLYDRNGYLFANSLIGISSALFEVQPYGVVLGAPGIVDGMGGVVLYKTNDFGADSFYTAIRADWDASIASSFIRRRGSYIGYSISSGRFGPSSLQLIATGAPHFSNERGHVGTVLLTEFTGSSIAPRKVLDGDTIGALFGASVLVMDVNGDGLDDLLIGSPLDSQQELDQGKVDVYHGTGDGNYITKVSILRGLAKVEARFGTCIANLGDISNDGYNDIAVGAPFEDELVGAVYIFNGGVNGLNTQYSQRISGQEVKDGLQSFGWHISSTLDVDDNQYGDFAVGSYLSDTTIILRTRPIVEIITTLTISTTVIPRNASGLSCVGQDSKPCVELEICLRYSGKGVDNGILIDYELRADTVRTSQAKSSRIHFYVTDEDQGDKVEKKRFMLSNPNTATCKTYIGRTPSLSKDFYRAIEDEIRFEVHFDLSNATIPGQVFPILAIDNDKVSNVTAKFESECESSCKPNLKLDMKLGSSSVIVGETNEIIAIIDVRNDGEPSYTTSINITTSSNTIFKGSQLVQGSEAVVCRPVINSTIGNIICDIDAPFRVNSVVRFLLRFSTTRVLLLPSIDDIENMQSHVMISSFVTSVGNEETDLSDNSQMLEIPVRLNSVTGMSGISQPEQKKVSNTMTLVKHSYVIYNRGPSPLPNTSVIITIPVRTVIGIVFVQEQNIQVSDAVSCTLSYPSNTATLPTTTTTTTAVSTSSVTNTSSSTSSQSVTTTTTIPPFPPLASNGGTESNITCSGYMCASLNCTLPVVPGDGEITVEVSITIAEAGLPFNATDVLVRYVTKGQIEEPQHPLLLPWNNEVTFQVFIQFFSARLTAELAAVNIWVIAAGCAGGLVLFIIVGIILWKCGFFKREKQAEVQKYKRMSNMQQRRRTQLAASRATLDSDSDVA